VGGARSVSCAGWTCDVRRVVVRRRRAAAAVEELAEGVLGGMKVVGDGCGWCGVQCGLLAIPGAVCFGCDEEKESRE
jgi:hypothetical protein